MRIWLVLGVALVGLLASTGHLACGAGRGSVPQAPSESVDVAPSGNGRVTLSVVGLNDLHGHVRRLPWIGGYVENLRAARREDGGGVLVVDAGDLFQGTLESNLEEGAAVVAGYEALGVAAAAIGNHEFDFGPVGPDAVPRRPDQDPRGALLARAAEADFPLLAANVLDADTGERVAWPGVTPSAMVEVAGLRVGVVGVSTERTPFTTIRANVADLRMAPVAATLAAEAASLRAQGADVVIGLAHAGGECRHFDDPDRLTSCDARSEIFRAVRALPEGQVDLVVAGHTHQGIAHRVAGVPVIESYAYGRAFGRVDLVVDRSAGRVVDHRIHPPQPVCDGDDTHRDVDPAHCEPSPYEGRPVYVHRGVASAIAPFLDRARAEETRELGVRLTGRFRQRYRDETALGNLLTDLMREARPAADVALQNGGGLRDDLPAGPLRYGAFYRTFPFDNRFAFVDMSGADLAEMIARNLSGRSGFLSVSGVRAEARCANGEVDVRLRRPDGRPVASGERLLVVTNEYLATSRDPVLRRLPEGAVRVEDGPPLRDVLARLLASKGGQLDPGAYHDPERPRVGRCE